MLKVQKDPKIVSIWKTIMSETMIFREMIFLKTNEQELMEMRKLKKEKQITQILNKMLTLILSKKTQIKMKLSPTKELEICSELKM